MTYLTAAFFVFSFSILAASIAIFLQERFENPETGILFVGFLLGFASFSALFMDVAWSYLQKTAAPRVLFFLALGGLMVTVLIFLLSHNLLILTILAALLYGWSFDLYDVTLLTTILKRGKKEEYAQNISQKKVSEAGGMFLGLTLSGIVLYFGSTVGQVILLIILLAVLLFAAHHFDRAEDEQVELDFTPKASAPWKHVFHDIADPEKLKGLLSRTGTGLKNEILLLSQETKKTLQALPHAAGTTLEVARRSLVEILAKENELAPEAFTKQKASVKEMWAHTTSMFGDFFAMFRQGNSKRMILLWAAIAIIFFSFWDTMAATFQPLFIKDVTAEHEWMRAFSGVLLASFILPILLLQIPFARLADRWGREKFVFAGVFLSGISLILLGLLQGNLLFVVLSGMLNSVGYALAFAPAQALFVIEIESAQAEKSSDEGSAALLRVATNIGNIFGQFLGGVVIAFLGFGTSFLTFGILLICYSVFSLFVLLRS